MANPRKDNSNKNEQEDNTQSQPLDKQAIASFKDEKTGKFYLAVVDFNSETKDSKVNIIKEIGNLKTDAVLEFKKAAVNLGYV